MKSQLKIIFVSATKKGENAFNILNCYFSKYYILSHKLNIYVWETKFLLLIYNISLIFSSIEMQRRLTQTKLYYKLSKKKRQFTTLQKQQLQKNLFLQCVCYQYYTTCFIQCFFIACDNWKILFFVKGCWYTEFLFNRHVAVPSFTLSLQ